MRISVTIIFILKVNNLKPGLRYNLRVKAKNQAGWSPPTKEELSFILKPEFGIYFLNLKFYLTINFNIIFRILKLNLMHLVFLGLKKLGMHFSNSFLIS
jgi:hypothetical protein